MSVLKYISHLIVANVLTLYYSAVVLALFAINFIKNPFADPWTLKLRLEPPPNLTDPKYGVHKYIKVNNIKLHYVESGDPSKPLIIFVHGFPEFWYSWRHQIVEFNKNYWCIAVDMRGYGDSERPEGVNNYKLSLLVDDIRDLIHQFGRQKAILVAHDWGGLIACHFRDKYPEMVTANIILASTTIESINRLMWSNAKQRRKSWYVYFNRMPALPEKLLQMNNVECFDKMMLAPNKDTVTNQDIECYKYWFGKLGAFTPPINYYRANFLMTVPKKDKCERNIPFLVVYAANDKFLSRDLIDSMRDEYLHLESVVLENCNHFLQQEEPEKVNKVVKEFLEKHKL